MSNKHSEQFQTDHDSVLAGENLFTKETEKLTQADQQPSEETYELSDDQLQSVVGGLRELAVIRIIGFEN